LHLDNLKYEDLTKKILALEEILKEKEIIQTALFKVGLLIKITKLDSTFIYASPSHESVLGYKPEELLGINEINIIHPDDKNALKDLLDQSFKRISFNSDNADFISKKITSICR